jgi:hypothetical protein
VPACLARLCVCARATGSQSTHTAQHSTAPPCRQTGDIALCTPARLGGRSVLSWALAVGRWRLCRGRGEQTAPSISPPTGPRDTGTKQTSLDWFRGCRDRPFLSATHTAAALAAAPRSRKRGRSGGSTSCGGESFIQTRPRICTARCGSRPLVSLDEKLL